MPTGNVLFPALLAAAIAALVTNLLVPAVSRLGVVDHPGGHKLHDKARPQLGGVAIVAGWALGAVAVVMIEWNAWGFGVGRSELVALAVGTLLVFLVGVLDDIFGVSVSQKFLVELVAAYLLVHIGWSFQVLALPGLGNIELGIFGELVSLLWIVGVTNAINLLDGLDGLAGGVVAIIATGLWIYAVDLGNLLVVLLMAAMVGACLGFLRHNWAPARIFMGDSGSLTLGFLLAAMSVHSSLKAPAAVAILVPILALGLPVMDTLVVMRVRFLDRPHGLFAERFLGMFRADRNHLHHVLEPFMARRARIVVAIYAAAFLFCAMALVVAVTHNAVLGIVLVALEFVAVMAMRNGRVPGACGDNVVAKPPRGQKVA